MYLNYFAFSILIQCITKIQLFFVCTQLKPNSPDFKHKDTGEGLWLGSSTPPWVLLKLPPVPTKQGDEFEKVAV